MLGLLNKDSEVRSPQPRRAFELSQKPAGHGALNRIFWTHSRRGDEEGKTSIIDEFKTLRITNWLVAHYKTLSQSVLCIENSKLNFYRGASLPFKINHGTKW